jgi:hypothetical protein
MDKKGMKRKEEGSADDDSGSVGHELISVQG